MKPERQLGLLWGSVAFLLVALSPMAAHVAGSLPPCPVRALVDLPCPSCGATRAALALSQLDLAAAFSASPLAALGWIGLVGGGLVVGLLAILGRPVREPKWVQSNPIRWLLMAIVLANWVYLVGAGV